MERTVTIHVNAQPTATLDLSQPEVQFHKIGDKVVEQDSATLNWSASNANQVSIQPFGTVADSGSKNIKAMPSQTNTGSFDHDVTYTLTAANPCGGTVTRTATLHVVGSIEPAPAVTLASVFYPTAYPEQHHPDVGLVTSEEQILKKAAATFKNNENYDAENRLMVVGHADVRGPEKYNLKLSERRAELVKNYLVSLGVPASEIEIQAVGKDKELDQQQVEMLQSSDAQQPQKWMTAREKATWLAYNRRVDIILEPSGKISTRAYPNDTTDARVLFQVPTPNLKTVESASLSVRGNETANMHASPGN